MARFPARVRLPLALRAGVIALATLVPACVFCGGQTGECTRSNDSESSTNCTVRSLAFADLGHRGFSAADLVNALGGTYRGVLELPATDAVTPPPPPLEVTFVVGYDGGSVSDDSCSNSLEVVVLVALTEAGGTLDRTGAGRLVGGPDAADLGVELPSSGADRPEAVSLQLQLAADGTATGVFTLGLSTSAAFTATRLP